MGRLIGFLFVVILVVIGLSFAVLNSQTVSLNYYFGQHDIPLSMIVVLALAAGALAAVVVSAGMILRQKAQIAQLRRRLRHAERAAEQMQVLPVDD